MDPQRRQLEVHEVVLSEAGASLPFHWREDLETALVVPLPQPVQQGESVTVELSFTLELAEVQGRWGHWKGVTFLANWHPVVAYYDEHGWQPTPFVAWHQPFFHEAGIYSVHLTLPADQKIASTGRVRQETLIEGGYKEVVIVGCCARDFALVCSDRFLEQTAQVGHVRVRVLTFPEYRHMAGLALQFASEVIPVYSRWFGVYPYDEFDIVQSHFPWNGNECSGMIMIDERVFAVPSIGATYVDHLITHETLHQWWYNVVGTNGYSETWMDEAVVSFYTARRLRMKYGRNAPWIRYPKGLRWLPNVHHDTYLFNSMYGTLGRGEATATVQPLPEFGNIVTLFSMTYDRGAKILGMIEEQTGEAAFYDFMRIIYSKYQFRILRVADFQRELEEYTGRSWKDFFDKWLYDAGMADWAIDDVDITRCDDERGEWRVVVTARQKGRFTEPTVLGVQFEKGGPYRLRLPVLPGAGPIDSVDPPVHSETLPDGAVQLTFWLPKKPVQISIDPDQVQPDSNPANNHWKPVINWRLTPLITPLDETDLTTMYDRWNVIIGPWAGVNGPWFGQRGYFGARAAVYRLQKFRGGVYTAYDFNDQDIRLGADALWDHWPLPRTQWGVQFDHSLTPDWAERRLDRGRVFGRYIFHYTSSFYLDHMEFVELYSRLDNEFWRGHIVAKPGIERYDDAFAVGVRYERFYYVPYWDPEGGYWFRASYEHGMPILGGDETFHRAEAQISAVKTLPTFSYHLSPLRVAVRLYLAGNLPDNGEMFQLGGATRLRGFDRAERQGSAVWIASAELRVPLVRHLDYGLCDNFAQLRHWYAVLFYDVGAIYLNGRTVGDVAHSVGVGMRFDTALFSFIERVTLRFDVAKVVNEDDPVQVWFGIQHAF